MSSPLDFVSALHMMLVFGFIGVTALFFLATLANRLRLSRVLTAWPTGRFFGLPVWPALFTALVMGLGIACLVLDRSMPGLFLGYVVGGVFWLGAVLMANAVVVAESGLVLHINRAHEAILWSQVVDYFEVTQGRTQCYVFFYQDPYGTRRRLEVRVPQRHRDHFSRIIRRKLDERFAFSARQGYGTEALEG